MLPNDLLSKSTAYEHFAAWRDNGTWPFHMDSLRAQVRVEDGREPSDFLSSNRILHRERELVVVSSKVLRRDQWRAIASEIEADVASDDP